MNFSTISIFFDFPACYITLPSILLATTKYESRKLSMLKILHEKLLISSSKDILLLNAQADLITTCLLDCLKHSANVLSKIEYFVDESILNRILQFSFCHFYGEDSFNSNIMIIKLQMLDSVRYIIQILTKNCTFHSIIRVTRTLHDWLSDLRVFVSTAQNFPNSLTACLKAIQIFESLLDLYVAIDFVPTSYHTEINFIHNILSMVHYKRQHVFLPHCITILKKIFSDKSPKVLRDACLDEILSCKNSWLAQYHNFEIKYFFNETYSTLNQSNLLTPAQIDSIKYLDHDNFDLTTLEHKSIEEEKTDSTTSYCVLL